MGDMNPYDVLELPGGANLEEARAAYLRLVKENPPDRCPERFREVHAAWTSLADPLVQAAQLIPSCKTPPVLSEWIAAAEKVKPPLPTEFLLSLGNDP